jgi:nitrogen regulatory protein PII
MKRIEATIRPFKVGEVKEALVKEGIQGLTFLEVRDFSQPNGYVKAYRGIQYVVDIFPRMRIELIVEDEEVRQVTDVILATLRTGHLCDGQIAILPVEEVIRVRTGQCQRDAR